MKRKLLNFIICTFLIISFTIIPSAYTIKASLKKEQITNVLNIYDKGWLEERNGIKILFINGSHYEMGYQHGSLLKYECLENLRAFLYYSEQMGYSLEKLLKIWDEMKDNVTQDYIDELHGLADGIEVSFDKVAAFYASLNSLGILNCFGFVAWDLATQSNKLIHARSFDLPFFITDPVTGKYAHENCVLIVRKPDNDYASIQFSIALLLNGGGGINEKGIAVGGQLSWSKDQKLDGFPLIIKEQIVQDKASTANEAINLLTTNRTVGVNFIISDSNNNIGYAIETTANHTYVGTWNNSVESNYPFWSIDHVVRRTNFFIEPEIASTQRNRYHPGGFIGLLKLILTLFQKNNKVFTPNHMFAIWRNYKCMSKEIEKQWGILNLDNTMSMLRNVYNGKTDILLAIMVRFGKGYGFLESWNQWVACPETGDIMISFANDEKYASRNLVHHFNLFELLES